MFAKLAAYLKPQSDQAENAWVIGSLLVGAIVVPFLVINAINTFERLRQLI